MSHHPDAAGGGGGAFSQVPDAPSFRAAAVNAVALVPLLSSTSKKGSVKPISHSLASFAKLKTALMQHANASNTAADAAPCSSSSSSILLLVPHNTMTRPSDWKYNTTPLKSFSWQHGCQRLELFDGHDVDRSRAAHDRLLNATVTRDWIDVMPQRRTAAVIGILNVRDCVVQEEQTSVGENDAASVYDGAIGGATTTTTTTPTTAATAAANSLQRAADELHSWTQRYATPPYETSHHGRHDLRDVPVQRLFVFDSFHESCQGLDLTVLPRMLAFPPLDDDDVASRQMMTMHLNVVLTDLSVAILQSLEAKILESEAIVTKQQALLKQRDHHTTASTTNVRPRGISRLISNATSAATSTGSVAATTTTTAAAAAGAASGDATDDTGPASTGLGLSLRSMTGLVGSSSADAKEISSKGPISRETSGATATSGGARHAGSSSALTADDIGSDTGSDPGTGAGSSTSGRIINMLYATPKLQTPLDENNDNDLWEHELTVRDVEAILRQDQARREKWAGDLCLLASSPLDAYSRYLKAAEAGKKGSVLDPLWYASSLEGCAAAHVCMAEVGGYNVDDYLDNNFCLPEEIMAMGKLKTDEASSNSGSQGGNKRHATSTTHKQTMPEIIFALCEEALDFIRRHPALAAYQAELLLKLAHYSSEHAESHLRCRWGEGPGCFADDAGGDVPRWERTSVAQLTFGDLKTVSQLDMISINSYHRVKRVCELLHEAVAVASLDSATRVDVALRASRLCLEGVRATQWRKVSVQRMKLPRKAAFFATVAAEALSSRQRDKTFVAESLWLMATHLYAAEPNRADRPDNAYGWATLRAMTLHALSMQGTSFAAQDAAELLLALLGELSLHATEATTAVNKSKQQKAEAAPEGSSRPPRDASTHGGGGSRPGSQHGPASRGSQHGSSSSPTPLALKTSIASTDGADVLDETTIKSNSTFASMLRESINNRTGFSTYLAAQSSWAEKDPGKCVELPFGDNTKTNVALAIRAAWCKVTTVECALAQQRALDRIGSLRRALPAASSDVGSSATMVSGENMLPLYIASVVAVAAESTQELEIVKCKVDSDAGAMATFYNPFAAKKADDATIRISEGEEHVVAVCFGNRLAADIEVRGCRLDFVPDDHYVVKCSPLSFTLPRQAATFKVHFPFTFTRVKEFSGDCEISHCEVRSIGITLLGRTISLPVAARRHSCGLLLPASCAEYPHQTIKVKTDASASMSLTFEIFPSQPCLQLSLIAAERPLSAATVLPIALTQGETLKLPDICATNSGTTRVECLQIFAVGIPGSSDKSLLLYDSQSFANSSKSENATRTSRPKLVSVRAMTTSGSIDAINSSSGATVSLEIATSDSIDSTLVDNVAACIRFRYRGPSTDTNEVWKRFDLPLSLSYSRGPRITSLEVRSSFGDYLFLNGGTVVGNGTISVENNATSTDSYVDICGDSICAIVTVKNDAAVDVKLYKPDGPIGGLSTHTLDSVVVRSGVDVRIPVMIPRLFRRATTSGTSPPNIAQELASQLAMHWRKLSNDGSLPHSSSEGIVRISVAELQNVLNKSTHAASRLCQAPCTIMVEATLCKVTKGTPVIVAAVAKMADWWPDVDLADSTRVTTELACRMVTTPASGGSVSHEGHMLCGMRQKRFAAVARVFTHDVKLVFVQNGQFQVSAALHIEMLDNTVETWWAPTVVDVVVED